MAARFSATKSTRLPSPASEAMRLAMVCDLPVPGGPLMTRWAPLRNGVDGALLGGVGVEDEGALRDGVCVGGAVGHRRAHGLQRPGVTGERCHHVVVGVSRPLGGEVGDHRQWARRTSRPRARASPRSPAPARRGASGRHTRGKGRSRRRRRPSPRAHRFDAPALLDASSFFEAPGGGGGVVG